MVCEEQAGAPLSERYAQMQLRQEKPDAEGRRDADVILKSAGGALTCRTHRHQPLKEQCAKLSAKLRGHFGYFGITGNSEALQRFRMCVQRIWQKWLARRSAKGMTWERFTALLLLYPLPSAKAVHSTLRFAAKL